VSQESFREKMNPVLGSFLVAARRPSIWENVGYQVVPNATRIVPSG
jgi:hypothetical protein